MYKLDFLNEEQILTKGQQETVELVMKNISNIIDMDNLKAWCKKNEVKEVIIFGSRTRLQEKEDSDLDIMIVNCPEIKNMDSSNYIRKQREVINNLYGSFLDCILDKSIELDFKLNTSCDDAYYGITFGTDDSEDGEVDFYFSWEDIPSYISVTEDDISFTFMVDLSDVFDGDVFAIVK